ncbi:MFS transporter [Albimonas pacifica]|uniref:Predicted arabinose efflux permease, MFS family n=1 Tax=Albimonas pacifica TaxID=1114924 RepID=A0A1I3BLS7_9RHOB|nr:MFS transporter [Albimonas pacifica]SFH63222.1 Predicted arabinose efflux permease, MFS family [Albimonas pacifica]
MTPLHAPLLALCLFAVTFAVNLQAPLYPAYLAQAGLGAGAATLAFAAYVAGLMPTLILLGGLSDRVGRRAPLVCALLLSFAATLLLALSPGWAELAAARVLLGIGTGLATPAGTAWMAELMGEARAKPAALMVTSATTLGFGGGALATGLSLMAQGPSFAPASFWALLIAAPPLALACLRLPRIAPPRRVSPLRLPVFPAGSAPYGLALALAWASTGMTIAATPLLLARLELDSWSGPVIFLALFVGFLCQPLARRTSNPRALRIGLGLIPLGFAGLLAGAATASVPLILLGTALTSAASYGFVYLAALSEVSALAPENRARAAAGLFVYAYCGFSAPVVAAGALADRIGLVPAMGVFFAAQLACLLALAGAMARAGRLRARRAQTSAAAPAAAAPAAASPSGARRPR